MSLEGKSSSVEGSDLVANLVSARVFSEKTGEANDVKAVNYPSDCYGLCQGCDCVCNQPCDGTTPGCYSL